MRVKWNSEWREGQSADRVGLGARTTGEVKFRIEKGNPLIVSVVWGPDDGRG